MQRIEPETVLLLPAGAAGRSVGPRAGRHSLKALFATGLFADVKLDRAGQHADRQRGRKPDHQPHRLRG